MLLAGAIVGVAAPILLQRTSNVNADFIRVGSVLLLVNIIVGAVFDAIDERRTTPLLIAAGADLRAQAALALAEDSKLLAAVAGDPDPDIDATIERATRTSNEAHRAFRSAGDRFATGSSVESALFFSAFVVGILLLVLAVGTAG